MGSVYTQGVEKVDEIIFVQVLYKVFQQMGLKAAINKHGDGAVEGFVKELRQLHMRDSFIPKRKRELT